MPLPTSLVFFQGPYMMLEMLQELGEVLTLHANFIIHLAGFVQPNLMIQT